MDLTCESRNLGARYRQLVAGERGGGHDPDIAPLVSEKVLEEDDVLCAEGLPLDVLNGERGKHRPAFELIQERAAACPFARLEGLAVVSLGRLPLVLLHQDLNQEVIQALLACQEGGAQLRQIGLGTKQFHGSKGLIEGPTS